MSGAYSNIAFPPLYPFVVRLLSWPIPGSEGIVAVLVSNVAFLAALALLVRLGTPYLGRRRATIAAGLLVIYPFASVFAMAYSESLFLLLMVAAFLAAERGHRAWAGIFLALTVLCRLQGIALVLPLLILMLRQDGWRPRPSLGWLLLGPLAGVAFLGLHRGRHRHPDRVPRRPAGLGSRRHRRCGTRRARSRRCSRRTRAPCIVDAARVDASC